jgi:copper chaperone for superoxide dismutase
MECQDCVDSVSKILKEIKGVNAFDVSLEDQSVFVEGTVAPSKITKALRESGRAAVLRGSGDSGDGLGRPIEKTTNAGAAVCILDMHRQDSPHQDVRGLVRMVQLPTSPPRTFIEVTMSSYPPGDYDVIVRESGNLTRGVVSAGQALKVLGTVHVDERGWGEYSGEVDGLQVWEVLGHAVSVDKACGVAARSAGVWENVKKVCACSGRTIWEEHQVMAKQTAVL